MKKHYILFAFFIGFALPSCQKTVSDPPGKNATEILAQKILKEKMAPADFASLNWSQASLKKLEGKDFLLVIPSTEKDKNMYFSNFFGNPVYNWARLEKRPGSPGKTSGTLTILNAGNQILNKFVFIDNKVVQPPGESLFKTIMSTGKKYKTFIDEGGGGTELPPVTVVGYIHSSYYDYNCLYWLFNMNMTFQNFFEGGGTDMPILDANYANSGPYKTYATRDIYPDGTAQITNTNPGAFYFSGLRLTFLYNSITNQLNPSSVSATTTGLFAGTWTGPTVNNITSTSTSISFWFTYTNSYDLMGIHFTKDYKMKIDYTTTTNEITWTWQP